jgi:hypothetical protein
MPTLIRFLVIVGTIAGIAWGALYVLANHLEPEPKEVSKSVPGVKVRRQ